MWGGADGVVSLCSGLTEGSSYRAKPNPISMTSLITERTSGNGFFTGALFALELLRVARLAAVPLLRFFA